MGFLVIHDLGDGDAVQGPVWTLSVYGGVDVQMFHYCLISDQDTQGAFPYVGRFNS